MPAKLEMANRNDILKAYLAGVSEKELAQQNGVSRDVIRRLLREDNIKPRGRSAAMRMRWQRSTIAERNHLVEAAHAATRGRKASILERERRAKTLETSLTKAVPIEAMLALALRNRALSITEQKAISIYNVDIAINEPPIAVEIFGGGWHAYGSHQATFHKRTKYLLDHGWHVVIVWLDARKYPFGPGCVEYLVSFAKELRAYPPRHTQYRVILGNGQNASIRKTHFNTWTDIERLGSPIETS